MSLKDLNSLTDNEIRKKFQELGFPVGPVTATTKGLLLKKLKALLENSEDGKVLSPSSKSDKQAHLNNDDQHDENSMKTTRRRSLPRTGGNKSPTRKRSPARANSSFNDFTDSKRTTESLNSPLSIASSTKTSNESLRNIGTPLLSDKNISPRYSASSEMVSSSQNNTGVNDITSSSRYLNSGLSFGLDSSYRSRFNDSTNNDQDFNSSLNQSSYTSGAGFSSDFVRRLAASRNLPKSDFRGPISPGITSKLLDVKESDDEDSGPAPVYAKFSHGGSRGTPVTNTKHFLRSSPPEKWFHLDSPTSAFLFFLFIIFFVVIGIIYINKHSPDTNVSPLSDIIFPVCINMPSHVPEENCIRESDKDITLRLFTILYKELYDRALNGPCNYQKQEPILFTDDDIINLIVEQDKLMSVYVVEQHLKNLKVLLDANPRWKIKPVRQGISIEEQPISNYCFIMNNIYLVVDWFWKISITTLFLYITYLVTKWWMRREARYKEDVYKLVSNVIDIVSSKARTDQSFVPVNHVRDQLIPLKDREKMKKLWMDALAILEYDSRLRCEVQEVEGEQYQVWRWLASSPVNSSKRKVWQGQAFATMEGSVNSLPHSPTSCLKIRHMFDAVLEEGDDWVTAVVNAILEKCNEAKILHVVVDKQSREGCVYMKCASPTDAGIAYRALHGSWFDSNLVTVKYIREKRYLERFPESTHCTQQLFPTNSNKESFN